VVLHHAGATAGLRSCPLACARQRQQSGGTRQLLGGAKFDGGTHYNLVVSQ
jgi:hypothetical protein